MATLNAKQRQASATIVVGGKAKYPIPDKAHARAALGRINQAEPPLTSGQKARVRARANQVLGTKGSAMKPQYSNKGKIDRKATKKGPSVLETEVDPRSESLTRMPKGKVPAPPKAKPVNVGGRKVTR